MIKVVCAIIEYEDKILIAQRSENMKLPLKWEFPGGKIEEGENKKEALEREIYEELKMKVEVKEALTSVEHHYPNFSITLYPFLCKVESHDFFKTEHKEIRWEKKENLQMYDWAAADIPIVEEIMNV